MADALDLASRMPVAWTSVLDGDLQALRVAFKLGFVEAQRFQEYGAEQWLGVWRSPVSFNARI